MSELKAAIFVDIDDARLLESVLEGFVSDREKEDKLWRKETLAVAELYAAIKNTLESLDCPIMRPGTTEGVLDHKAEVAYSESCDDEDSNDPYDIIRGALEMSNFQIPLGMNLDDKPSDLIYALLNDDSIYSYREFGGEINFEIEIRRMSDVEYTNLSFDECLSSWLGHLFDAAGR